MVWCYCYHLHSQLKFCENFITKIISITPFVNYVLSASPTQWVAEIGCKDNERYLNKYSHNGINPVLHVPKHIYWYKTGYIYTLTL